MAVKTIPGFVIAGTHSGAGKTTVTMGIMASFRELGMAVQPFKCGPDYIDPGLHTAIAGRPSRNLDSWLCTVEVLREIFSRASSGADISVVEGMMGLFDGVEGKTDSGSAAEIARIVGLPVILVIDAGAIARSAAAIVMGFQKLDPGLNLAGVILNKVGGILHRKWLQQAIENETGVPVLGFLPNDPRLRIQERHLGLLPAREKELPAILLDALKQHVKESFRIKSLLRIARSESKAKTVRPHVFVSRTSVKNARIAVALDRAFHFYYRDNLDLLELNGAELLYFQPTDGDPLPEKAQGLLLGGGFPEVYAREISRNRAFLKAIRQTVQKGMPVYAECGGLMCLCDSIVAFDGKESKMAGIIPSRAIMNKRLSLGYARVRNTAPNLLGGRGSSFRGHVFHHSNLEPATSLPRSYDVRMHGVRSSDGITTKNVLASYVHVHFASDSRLAANLVKHCAGFGQRGTK